MTNNTHNFCILLSIIFILPSFFGSLIAANEVEGQEQILVKDNIKIFSQYGEYTQNPDYLKTYNASNAFDGLENTWSYWSQYGKAGFTIDLLQKLDKPVCNVELNILNPNNSPFVFGLNNQSFNGVFDSKQVVGTAGCVPNVDKLSLDVDGPSRWTTVSEIKLYTNATLPPPPTCEPGYHWDENLKKCVPDIIPPPGGNVTELYFNNTKNTLYMDNSELIIDLGNSSNYTLVPLPFPMTPNPVSPIQPTEPNNEDDDNGNGNGDKEEEEEEDEEEEQQQIDSELEEMLTKNGN